MPAPRRNGVSPTAKLGMEDSPPEPDSGTSVGSSEGPLAIRFPRIFAIVGETHAAGDRSQGAPDILGPMESPPEGDAPPLRDLLARVRPGGDFAARTSLSALQASLFGRAPAPTRIGPYAIARRLGAGSSGVVYRAVDTRDGAEVALKLLRSPDARAETARARLLREAQSLAQLRHPGIVRVLDVGTYDTGAATGTPRGVTSVYVAMELVAGPGLDRWLDMAPRSWRQVLDLLAQAGDALAAAHAAGIVHRDFKPSNVIVAAGERACVVDFGLARALPGAPASSPGLPRLGEAPAPELDALAGSLDLTLTKPGVVLGTPCYMAPELHSGARADASTDQYAFCVALYEAWCRQRPFDADDELELVRRKLSGDVPAPPRDVGLPAAALAVVRRGLRPRAEERFESMGALLEALGGAADRPDSVGRRSPAVPLAIAGIVVAIAMLVWIAIG
jgi:eukaryotic-like serine/threonine-protein kinase